MFSRFLLLRTACLVLAIAALCIPDLARAQMAGPFEASAEIADEAEPWRVIVEITVPPDHYLYADMVSVNVDAPWVLQPVDVPDPTTKYDPFFMEDITVYEQNVRMVYVLEGPSTGTVNLTVNWQGCSKDVCFRPESETFGLRSDDSPTESAVSAEAQTRPQEPQPETALAEALDGWRVTARGVGYMKSDAFLGLLEAGQKADKEAESDWSRRLRLAGPWMTALLILLGGLLLNLTPCVLPMIPVNLAIIGAGGANASRLRGFGLGLAYGLGITVAYGALGLVVLLTGKPFGTLNASPWFNFSVAVIFLVLGLALFDVFSIDFSRVRERLAGNKTGSTGVGSVFGVFLMGGLAALLAGACVAPVVIAVLLFGRNLWAEGQAVGLVLPFLLGAGMALPWPLAGAGIGALPRPGRWMQWVKYGFAVVVILLGVWYGTLGYKLLDQRVARGEEAQVAEAQEKAVAEGPWEKDLRVALARARSENRPVLVDFWASWCKSCIRMEHTTFQDPEVLAALEAFVPVKYRAEDQSEPATARLLDRLGVSGLPTYVVLKPASGTWQKD